MTLQCQGEPAVILGPRDFDRAKRAQMRRDELGVKQAEAAPSEPVHKKRQRDRSARMLEEQLISQQEFDDQESAWRMAKAERDLGYAHRPGETAITEAVDWFHDQGYLD